MIQVVSIPLKSFQTLFVSNRLVLLLALGWAIVLACGQAQSEEGAAETSVVAPQSKPAGEALSAPRSVYVVPVRGDIDASIVYVIRRGVKEAIDNNADHLILHMDTYGGRVDKTEEITAILRRFENQEETYTFIDTKAISAGAFIASATRRIYMAPASVIGAATPVMMAPGGQVQSVNEAYEEKISSALRALVRANAEFHGHNPDIFDAMIDRDQGLTVGGEEVVAPGKILTLTSNEAARIYGDAKTPLLSSGTVENLDALIKQIGGPDAVVTKIEPTGMEEVARFLVSLAPILMAGAFLFGYIEFKTPGFGLFGAIAVVCALLFFFGHSVAGLTGHEFMLLFFVGVVLILAELLLVPGTIVVGVTGFLLVVISLLKAMIDVYPNEPSLIPSMTQIEAPLQKMGLAMLLTLAGIWVLARVLPRTPMYAQLILETTNASPSPVESLNLKRGMTGHAITPLRPSGSARFSEGGPPVDVVTEGDFIPAGTQIRIELIDGSRVVVAAVEDSAAS